MLEKERLLQKKYYQYLINPTVAKDLISPMGMDAITEASLTHQYQTDERRVLLDVEQKRAKQIQAIFEADGLQRYRVSVTYHSELLARVLQDLSQPQYILNTVLNLPDTFSDIIDCLYDPRLNFVRLERLISEDTQLVRDVLGVVNSKEFWDSIERPSKSIRDLKGAFGILGVKGLQYLIPLYIMKSRIPLERGLGRRGTEDRLWEGLVSTVNAHIALLKVSEPEDNVCMEGIMLGLLEGIAPIVIYKLYFKHASSVRSSVLAGFERSAEPKLYELMVKLKLNLDVLPGIMNDHGRKVFNNLGTCLKWTHTPRIRRAFEEENEYLPTTVCSKHTVIHRRATQFNHYNTLKDIELMTEEESLSYLQEIGIESKDTDYLKTHNIDEFSLHQYVG